MFRKVIRSAKFAIGVHRMGKLYNAHKYKEALELISKLDGPREEMAKLTLVKANIMNRSGSKKRAVHFYEDFLRNDIEFISARADRSYLSLYAKYYLNGVKAALGMPDYEVIPKENVMMAYRRASIVARADFVFDKDT